MIYIYFRHSLGVTSWVTQPVEPRYRGYSKSCDQLIDADWIVNSISHTLFTSFEDQIPEWIRVIEHLAMLSIFS